MLQLQHEVDGKDEITGGKEASDAEYLQQAEAIHKQGVNESEDKDGAYVCKAFFASLSNLDQLVYEKEQYKNGTFAN